MTPGPRSPRRPGSIISRLPALGLPFVLPRALDATAASSATAPGHEPLQTAVIPADLALLAGIAGAILLGFAALAVVRRRRRFEAGAGDAPARTAWAGGTTGEGSSGSRDPLVSLMTRPTVHGRGGGLPAGRSRRHDDQAAWVRRLDRPGRHDEDRTA